MKLSVIIVSYNVKYYLEQCLHSVFRSADRNETEIFVVDNASADNTAEHIAHCFPKEEYPQLHFIANESNEGFSRANNKALKKSQGEYVLFLNPDTLIAEDTLQTCLNFMETHKDTGAVGTRMLKPTGEFAPESRRGLPTPFTSFCKLTGLSRLFPHSRIFGCYYMSYLCDKSICKIDVVSGAFMIVPRCVLQTTGGFDETFFMYGEDIDLSYRITKAGYQNYYLPTNILHYKGESTEKTSFRYVYVFYEAMLIFFNKHYRHLGVLCSLTIKSAIFLLGLWSLIQQKASKWQHRKFAKTYIKKYLFIGSTSMLEQARDLCRKFNLEADFIEGTEKSLPQGHTSDGIKAEEYRFAVYDMESYSTAHILRLFNEAGNGYTLIGTYYPEYGQLITSQNTYLI